jgi:hypothetical protein
MMPEEKKLLLELLIHRGKWSRDVEARDADGEPVNFDDESAVSWDITGALCHLFGWKRACVLFGQLERHFVGKHKALRWPAPDPSIDAMRVLQDFNDDAKTTFEFLRRRLEEIPVWSGGSRAEEVELGA